MLFQTLFYWFSVKLISVRFDGHNSAVYGKIGELLEQPWTSAFILPDSVQAPDIVYQ